MLFFPWDLTKESTLKCWPLWRPDDHAYSRTVGVNPDPRQPLLLTAIYRSQGVVCIVQGDWFDSLPGRFGKFEVIENGAKKLAMPAITTPPTTKPTMILCIQYYSTAKVSVITILRKEDCK